MSRLRLFIALPLDEAARERAARVQDALRRAAADLKWVEPSHFHLTLAFLGWVDAARVADAEAVLAGAAAGQAPFELRFSTLGCFGSARAPRVVWLGLSEGEREARALALRLAQGLRGAGLPVEDREFRPHLTLGRARKTAAPLPAPGGFEPFSCSVRRVALFRSRLSPRGPSYEELAAAALG